MRRLATGWALAVTMTVLLAACESPRRTGCVEGDAKSCACSDGRTGAQICGADGTYAMCVCTGGLDLGTGDDAGHADGSPDAASIDASRDGAGGSDADLDAGTGVDAPGPTDAGTDGPIPIDASCTPGTTRPVDLLLVVDNSPSMTEEQASLAAALPMFVGGLTTGDVDGDGTAEYVPIGDLHVGVIDVNMGVGGIPAVPTCSARPDFGDDGVLLTTSLAGGPSCAASYPHFLAFDPATAPGYSLAQLIADTSCLARTGTGGCGFEQQLDAPLKALLPGTSPVTFYAGTHGHGDDPATNGGFVRPTSVVVVIDVTDEDDCSTDQTDIWDPTSSTHTGDLNLRCINYFDELYPVSRFVDGFASLRPGRPDVIFVAITGVPTDLITTPIDWPTLFADTRMQNTVVSPAVTVVPACSSPGRGSAAPGIRMAHVVEDFGAAGILASICTSDYTPALTDVVAHVSARARCAP